MTEHAFVTPQLLRSAIRSLSSWVATVKAQSSRHVWSLLPIKLAGARPGVAIDYSEADDRRFMDRFLRCLENEKYPYFDPLSPSEPLPEGYYHSNMATTRKRTFAVSWGAARWDGRILTLEEEYPQIFRAQVLTKASEVHRLPALALSVWFFKRPSAEWPDDPELQSGIPTDPIAAVEAFRTRFNFSPEEMEILFNEDFEVLGPYRELLEMPDA